MPGFPLKSDGSVPINSGSPGAGKVLTATGTAGFYNWQTPAASGTMSSWLLAASGTGGTESITDGETVTFSGSGIVSVTRSTNTITISASGDNLGNHTATTSLDMAGNAITSCDLVSNGSGTLSLAGLSEVQLVRGAGVVLHFSTSANGVSFQNKAGEDCSDFQLTSRSSGPGNTGALWVDNGSPNRLRFHASDGTNYYILMSTTATGSPA